MKNKINILALYASLILPSIAIANPYSHPENTTLKSSDDSTQKMEQKLLNNNGTNNAEVSVKTELNILNRVQLAQMFPEGNTENNFNTAGFQIKQIIVVRGSHGDDYRMIHCKWGQTFYKKNGMDISEYLFYHDTSKSN